MAEHVELQPRVQCSACGADNMPAALFCRRCTAPLSIVALGDLTGSDRRECLSALFSVLAEALSGDDRSESAVQDDLWRAYLNALWLRPETALILYAEAMAIQTALPDRTGPWLDLGCGDGVHTAIYSGWRFDQVFDVFQSLDLTLTDIYHHWDPKQFTAKLIVTGRSVDFGLDIKPTAIARAAALNIFSRLQQADATELPLSDRSVTTIFSNMLRDLGDPLPAALGECRRVLSDDGQLLISAMTPAYAHHLHFAAAARSAESQANTGRARQMLRLDRGRSIFCQRQLSVSGWQSLLAEQGLCVKSVVPIVGPSIIRFWDIGLRPFSVQLLRQRQTWIEAGVLEAVKPGLVDLLDAALKPLLHQLNVGEPCMNLLVVGKS